MPRKIPIIEKREWLNSYEQGKSEASIARTSHHDVKTVKKGIEQARRERDAQTANTGVLKDALTRHQNSLLGIVEEILSALIVPPPNMQVPSQRPIGTESISLPGATLRFSGSGPPAISLNSEGTLLWELFNEHLKRDPMWKVLKQWKSALAAHAEARIALKQKTMELLKTKTGLDVLDEKPVEGALVYSQTVHMFYSDVVYRALGIPGDRFEKDRVATQPNGQVVYGPGKVLVVPAGKDPECQEHILQALDELRACTEARNVAITYEMLEAEIQKATRVVQELSLLGLVPGTCHVCRRLGV